MQEASGVSICPWGDRAIDDVLSSVNVSMGLELPDDDGDRVDGLVHRPWCTMAVDGDDVVGAVGAYRWRMSVPYGEVPAVGTTQAGVLPTHRRQGLLRRMLEGHLTRARADGCGLAALWASEAPIYGRFGYGSAAPRGQWTIQARRCRPLLEDEGGRITLHRPERVTDDLKTIYERHWRDRAGAVSRSEAWWKGRSLFDAEWRRHGMGRLSVAVHRTEAGPQGYVLFRRKSEWVDQIPHDRLWVVERFGSNAACRALWRFLMSIDLVESIVTFSLPVDDPLPLLVDDVRQVALKPQDALWVRLLDVPMVLSSRRYEVEAQLVVDVRPAPFGLEGRDFGRFSVKGARDDAHCTPTAAPADITVDLADLGALALGGESALRLAAAGRLEGRPDAVDQAERLFRTARAPCCPEQF